MLENRPLASEYLTSRHYLAGLTSTAEPLALPRLTPEKISVNKHPMYDAQIYERYRLTYTGGEEYIERYLVKRFDEDDEQWQDRKRLSYVPKFAGQAVDEYVRALSQRAGDVKRIGGRQDYLEVCAGENLGVDRKGLSLNGFMANEVVPELLSMGCVGIYVDNYAYTSEDTPSRYKHPYLYTYKAESILNWAYASVGTELSAVLLQDTVDSFDPASGLCNGIETNYRYIRRTHSGAVVAFYDDKGLAIGEETEVPTFPFILAQLPFSLLRDIARYQSALMNLASSDFYYAWAGNFPLYTEQQQPFSIGMYNEERYDQGPLSNYSSYHAGENAETQDTEDTRTAPVLTAPGPPLVVRRDPNKLNVGTLTGRKYAVGTERPGWVAPPTDPLIASMSKEEQMKTEMRRLAMLSVVELSSRQSADAKNADRESGVEAGLSRIGAVLEAAENLISVAYHAYLNHVGRPTRAKYPEKYSLRSDDERRADAKELRELQNAVPSITFAKETGKEIASILYAHKLPSDTLAEIRSEIDASPVPTCDPEVLAMDHEAGFVSDRTASMGRGYGPDEHIQAQEDRAKRAAAIAIAQSAGFGATAGIEGGIKDAAARGVPELALDDEDGVDEKNAAHDPDKNVDSSQGRRGKGKQPEVNRSTYKERKV